jgi:hypothetical protein
MITNENLLMNLLSVLTMSLIAMIAFIGNKIHSAIGELGSIINGLRAEIGMLDRRVTRSEEKIGDLQERLNYHRRLNDEDLQ